MDSLFEHYKRTGYLHHAYCIEGAPSDVVPRIVTAIEQHLGMRAQGNPDIIITIYDSFGVDEARALKEAQVQSSFGGGRRVFVVGVDSFTREAQNALLKTFEEPTPHTHFFIVIPRLLSIIPTLKSRVVVVPTREHAYEDDTNILAQKFVDGSLKDRFALAKKIGEAHDREMARRVLDHIERILYTRMAGKHDQGIFHELFRSKTYLADRGSSPKMLLEHLAIVLR